MTPAVDLLSSYRLPFGVELDTQDAIARLFEQHAVPFVREYDLGPAHGRIDFYLPDARIGLEVKTQGSPSSVAEQLMRYATADAVARLILVTGRVRLGQLPSSLHGKPLTVVSLWRGAF